MFKDRCLSVTDLRTKTKDCLSSLEDAPKYIFVNNHPVAVLLDILDFERSFNIPVLHELSKHEVTASLRRSASRAKKSKRQDLVNL